MHEAWSLAAGSTCPAEAVTLQQKPAEEQRVPPRSAQEMVFQLAEKRGKTLVPLAAMRKG